MLGEGKLISKFEAILGGDHVLNGKDAPEEYSINGQRPTVIVKPADAGEVCAALRLANEEKLAVVPMGSGTKLDVGNPPSRMDVILSLSRLQSIGEYDFDNLSVTVSAGLCLEGLRETLSRENQFLPLDPYLGDLSTVGGVVATNSSGPRRFGYGSVRDLVLGMSCVLPTGEAVSFGGKVTKNVAGYDMTKLFIGSFGTLGVITEATFKIYPIFEAEKTALIAFRDLNEAQKMLEILLGSYLEPNSVDLLSPSFCDKVGQVSGVDIPQGWIVAVRVDGIYEAVERQINETVRVGEGSAHIVVENRDQDAYWKAVSDMGGLAEARFRLKSGVPISRVCPFLYEVEELRKQAGIDMYVYANAGSGAVYLLWDEGDIDNSVDIVIDSRRHAEKMGGHLTVEKAPNRIKTAAGVWGNVTGGIAIMKAIADRFDPNGVMAPGRLF